MARVRCDECGHDFFVAYSCRCRVVCPSCSTKRSILFGEKVREIVKPVPHLHITFTIPRILRACFRRNRRLLKLLVQYYYGIYSSSHRGKERKENRCNQGIEIQEIKGTGRASSTWARLIHRIFEVDPLLCTKCGGNMRVISFITDYQTSKEILKHIGKETVRPPPVRAKTPTANIPDTVFWDSIPSEKVWKNRQGCSR